MRGTLITAILATQGLALVNAAWQGRDLKVFLAETPSLASTNDLERYKAVAARQMWAALMQGALLLVAPACFVWGIVPNLSGGDFVGSCCRAWLSSWSPAPTAASNRRCGRSRPPTPNSRPCATTSSRPGGPNRYRTGEMGEKPKKPHVCPWWLGNMLLASPIRRIFEKPEEIPAPLVRRPACWCSTWAPPWATSACRWRAWWGLKAGVVCLDVHQRMLSALDRRARRRGLEHIIETRLCSQEGLGVDDLALMGRFCDRLPRRARNRKTRESFINECAVALAPWWPPAHRRAPRSRHRTRVRDRL